jgi:3'-phosphoadenosine 5'-phosphosulfate sulfotransferase (PAPS reductase)/FAD synthetase
MQIPEEIKIAIEQGAVIALSTSGGKDSQAMMKVVVDYYNQNQLSNKIFAIHADLGRAEWKQTPYFVEKICKDLGIELVIVRRERNGKTMDLIDRWQERRKQLEGTGKPFWSSAKQRYCTSDMKAEPINKYLRQFENVISVEGIRWQESKARSEKPRVKVRTEIATRKRQALTWNAICDYSLSDVFATYGQTIDTYKEAQKIYRLTGEVPSFWNFHPAYAMGNQRLSCAICILGSKNDVANGIKHNPELAHIISDMENQSGFTLRQGLSISQIAQQSEVSLFPNL